MSSYTFSFTPLPSALPGGTDVQVAMTSPLDGETTVVEVKRHAPAPVGNHLEVDRVILDARSRIAAITGLEVQEVSLSAYARGYAL